MRMKTEDRRKEMVRCEGQQKREGGKRMAVNVNVDGGLNVKEDGRIKRENCSPGPLFIQWRGCTALGAREVL
jgi:hypothetical protein